MGTTTAQANVAITTGDQRPSIAAHTPGPWVVEESRVQDTGTLFETIRSEPISTSKEPDTGDIAYLTLRQREVRANAAFIVRACNAHDDLLALAREVASQFDDVKHPLSVEGRLRDAARAAIAKATGAAS